MRNRNPPVRYKRNLRPAHSKRPEISIPGPSPVKNRIGLIPTRQVHAPIQSRPRALSIPMPKSTTDQEKPKNGKCYNLQFHGDKNHMVQFFRVPSLRGNICRHSILTYPTVTTFSLWSPILSLPLPLYLLAITYSIKCRNYAREHFWQPRWKRNSELT